MSVSQCMFVCVRAPVCVSVSVSPVVSVCDVMGETCVSLCVHALYNNYALFDFSDSPFQVIL